MSALPLVSIVTPSFNQAQFLESTIRSVLNQDYTPLEYLIVDGGSIDGSVEIIQRYADQLAWWVSEPDSGQAEGINKGLQRARGEIVAWLNSDDIYLPCAIRQAVETLQANPALGMVYGDAITIDGNGNPLGRFSFEEWQLPDLMAFRIICQPAVFMRRSVLEKAGYLEHSFHFMLDHHLWIRMALQASVGHVGAGILGTPEPVRGLWAAARHHPGAKNVSQAAGFGRETLQVLNWMQAQTDLAAIFKENRRKILAGAYRLNARYLLDDGLYGRALVSYARALYYRPSFALKHWHRMLYAKLSLLGLKHFAKELASRQLNRHRAGLKSLLSQTLVAISEADQPERAYRLADWPGLNLGSS
jgi:glycosyltransferase involved in cell wall biosynthesis